MKILITGAYGFVGKALSYSAINSGYQVHFSVRSLNANTWLGDANSAGAPNANLNNANVYQMGNIDANSNWQQALDGVDVVIHLAARVHVMREHSQDSLAEFRNVNVAGTLNLANQAVKAGVKRFIFISSVKVNGEFTLVDTPFKFSDDAHPQDAYGVSKFEAEEGLKKISQNTHLEVVIIRPPLIYGRGVKANFANMLKLVKLGLPLPFGAIKNKRSLIYVDNLTSFITECITNPQAANKTFLVSDSEDVSTTQLLKACAVAQNKKIWLIPVPQSWLFFVFKLLGRQHLAHRLLSNLQIDSQYACKTLNWQPPFTLAQGLERTVNEVLDTDKVKI